MIDPGALRRMVRASAMVMEMTILVILGALGGAFLDRCFGTEPFLLLGLSMGMMVAGLVRLMRSMESKRTANEEPRNDSSPPD